MTVKYVLFPGHVTSKSDGERHYITAQQLTQLYSVPLHECVVVLEQNINTRVLEILLKGIKLQGLIELRPRYDGNYSLPDIYTSERESIAQYFNRQPGREFFGTEVADLIREKHDDRDCGNCAHNEVRSQDEPCSQCIDSYNSSDLEFVHWKERS